MNALVLHNEMPFLWECPKAVFKKMLCSVHAVTLTILEKCPIIYDLMNGTFFIFLPYFAELLRWTGLALNMVESTVSIRDGRM